MSKLYLVGITEDRTGLVLARSPRAKSGDDVLEVDPAVLEAVAEVRRFRAEGGGTPTVSSPALPARRGEQAGAGSRDASRLTPREIQSRLRRGESVSSVARRAGVDEWRVEIYAAPIVAEQARVIGKARQLVLDKRGSGPSGRPLGEAVLAGVVEKGVSMYAQEFETAWSAYEPEPDRWVVRFRYVSRGREQVAEWYYDPAEETVTAANRLGTVLGWRDPKRPGRIPPLPEAPAGGTSEATERGKQASRKKAAAKKTAAKKSGGEKAASSKKTSAKKASAKKADAKKADAKKASAKKASAKKAEASPKKKGSSKKQASTSKKAESSKQAPSSKKAQASSKQASSKQASSKQASSKPASSKKPSSEKPAPKQAPTKQAPTKQASAKKPAANQAPAKGAPTQKAPAQKAPAAKPAASEKRPPKKTRSEKSPAKKSPAKKGPAKRSSAAAEKPTPAQPASKQPAPEQAAGSRPEAATPTPSPSPPAPPRTAPPTVRRLGPEEVARRDEDAGAAGDRPSWREELERRRAHERDLEARGSRPGGRAPAAADSDQTATLDETAGLDVPAWLGRRAGRDTADDDTADDEPADDGHADAPSSGGGRPAANGRGIAVDATPVSAAGAGRTAPSQRRRRPLRAR